MRVCKEQNLVKNIKMSVEDFKRYTSRQAPTHERMHKTLLHKIQTFSFRYRSSNLRFRRYRHSSGRFHGSRFRGAGHQTCAVSLLDRRDTRNGLHVILRHALCVCSVRLDIGLDLVKYS